MRIVRVNFLIDGVTVIWDPPKFDTWGSYQITSDLGPLGGTNHQCSCRDTECMSAKEMETAETAEVVEVEMETEISNSGMKIIVMDFKTYFQSLESILRTC